MKTSPDKLYQFWQLISAIFIQPSPQYCHKYEEILSQIWRILIFLHICDNISLQILTHFFTIMEKYCHKYGKIIPFPVNLFLSFSFSLSLSLSILSQISLYIYDICEMYCGCIVVNILILDIFQNYCMEITLFPVQRRNGLDTLLNLN